MGMNYADPRTGEPYWLTWLRARVGLKEFAGPADNPKVVELFKLAHIGEGGVWSQDETPWCAAAVGAALEECGIVGTRSAMARSYERWTNGLQIGLPILGAVAVLDRDPPHPSQGHVAFVVGADRLHVALLGGNQGDAVNVKVFPRQRVRVINGMPAFYWPRAVDTVRLSWLAVGIPSDAGAGGSVT